MTTNSTHYEILGLPSSLENGTPIPAQTLRAAYKRALLQNHPDKADPLKCTIPYTIDQISEAFATLENPKSKSQYDKSLVLRKGKGATKGEEEFKTGVEVVDLDDLEEDEVNGIWYRSCRCGDDKGFEVREDDLEEAAEMGEVSVGCKGCSLWLRVLFGVVEEQDIKETGQSGPDA